MQAAAIAKRSRDIVLEQWHELLRLRREVLKTSDIEAIHDLRGLTRTLGGLRNRRTAAGGVGQTRRAEAARPHPT